ncbi:MAG: 4-hydroxy-tetrahydrodipicolinate synthase [Elusimicrobiota bacterium]
MMKFQGCYTALVTPFKDGALDEAALRKVVRFQLRGGVAGLVACGSTGEAATLSMEESERVVRITVEEAGGRVPVVAGVGTNDTAKAVKLAKEAERWGADALLVLVPYYNKPTQEGMFRHFKAVAEASSLPIIAYNIPGRTGVNMLPQTLLRIASELPSVRAVKEAAGLLDQVSEILCSAPKGFSVLSGDDSLTLPMMAVGATGVVSVVSNILPRETQKLCDLALKGDFSAAAKLHLKLFPFIKALFVETNPIPVKAAAHALGLCADELRLPLTTISPDARKALAAALRKVGL